MKQRALTTAAAIAALALAACSHGGNSTLPPSQSPMSATNIPSAKEASLRAEEAAHAKMSRASKHPGMLADVATSERWPTGIVESGLAPLPGAVYDITNQYQSVSGGRRVVAFAGSLRETHEAVVVVIVRSLDGHTTSAPTVTRVGGLGSARIVSADNGSLQLSVGTRRVPFSLPGASAPAAGL